MLSSAAILASLHLTTAMADASNAIGGGAINEKPRFYNPNTPLNPIANKNGEWDPEQQVSHMLHAIVGLDRYPNYMARFHDIRDVDALENALKQTLDKVGQQKSDMVERRRGINELVCYYNKLKKENKTQHSGGTSENDEKMHKAEPDIWGSDLSPPKSWDELKRRNILNDDAFRVAFQSMKTNPYRHCELQDIISGDVDLNLNPSLLEDLMDQEMFDVYSFPLLTAEVSLKDTSPILVFFMQLTFIPLNSSVN